MKKSMKRVLALVLAAVMIVGLLPADWTANNAKAATKQIDVTQGLTAGTVYGEEGVMTFIVGVDMPFKESAVTVDGVDYTGYVQGAQNAQIYDAAQDKMVTAKGVVPEAGAYFKFTPVVDCKVTMVLKAPGSGKPFHLVKESDGINLDGTTEMTENGAYKIDLTAGDTYYFYLQGSKPCVYDMSYTYAGSDYQRADIDVSAGLVAGTVYGKDTLATFTIGVDMPIKESNVTVDGVDYTGYVQGAQNAQIYDAAQDKMVTAKGVVPEAGAYFKFTPVVDCRVTMVLKAPGSGKPFHLVKASDGSNLDGTTEMTANGAYKVELAAGDTYYFYLQGSKPCVYAMYLEAGTKEIDWTTVAAPVIGEITSVGTQITVPYTAVIGDEGGEAVEIKMYNGDTLVDTQINKAPGTSGSVVFECTETGSYKFVGELVRDGKETKVGEAATFDFTAPLVKPVLVGVANKGNGTVTVTYKEVNEAESYEIFYSKDGVTFTSAGVTDKFAPYDITGLENGVTYSFKVSATRGIETVTSDVVTKAVENTSEYTWEFSAFGQGVVAKREYVGYSDTDKIKLWSKGEPDGKGGLNYRGKLVPASTDGLGFYYTAIPSNKNFTLSATITVDKWTMTNGQEGFGLMAADRVGVDGDASTFWNNSYMASITKVEYFADTTTGTVVQDTIAQGGINVTGYNKISYKAGIGSQEKIGVTKDNLATILGGDLSPFSSKMTTLDYGAAGIPVTGNPTYNLVGNYTNDVKEFTDTVIDNRVTFKLQIQKNNTGYFVSYTNPATNQTLTKKYYDTEALSQLDADNVYVGFFSSRAAEITVDEYTLTVINPEDDAPAEARPLEPVEPVYKATSSTTSNKPEYEVAYKGNADGHVIVTDSKGTVIGETDVEAGKTYKFPATLALGKNKFVITMKPNADYKPSEFEKLATYEEQSFSLNVEYNYFTSDVVYVGPNGSIAGKGTKNDPTDIYTAAKFAKPGQTFILLEGTYKLETGVTVQPGISGTAEEPIYLIADPEAKTRPVLDFNKVGNGIIFAGDYWYIQGFDVTNSANSQKGLQLSGDYCTLDNVWAYYNGNTGIQISRYSDADREDWPSNNLVLNCTSFGNADAGYEDADGFAAKLTIGEGNVFDGCIAHHNADDGWDLFAKPENGPIGKVVIKNSVAYANGYLEDGTTAGNGNGFKMGGSSIAGAHELIGCVAFGNRAKGLDSNSGPDISLDQCISFDNGSYNVAIYTNDAANTDYSVSNVISYRKNADLTIAEQIKLKGTQDKTKVYQSSNYLWGCADPGSNEANGTVNDTWFVSVDTKDEGNGKYSTPCSYTYTEEDGFVMDINGIITRKQSNGYKIEMNGLLELTDASGVAASFASPESGATSAVITVTGENTTGLALTGDATPIAIMVTLLIASAAAFAVVLVMDKKKKAEAK